MYEEHEFKGQLTGRLFQTECGEWLYTPYHIARDIQYKHPAIARAYQKADGSWRVTQITPLPRASRGPSRRDPAPSGVDHAP